MTLKQINFPGTGVEGVTPRYISILTDANLSAVTTAGFITQAEIFPNALQVTDVIAIVYNYNAATRTASQGWFSVSISNNVYTLTETVSAGNVLLPVVNGDFAIFNGTSGQIKDAGFKPTNAAKTWVVMSNGSTVSGTIAGFFDTNGTIGVSAGALANPNGNLQAGSSGHAGGFVAYPATASKGTLQLIASNNGANYDIQLTNAAFGQACTITIPDPALSSAYFMLFSGSLTSGNLLKTGAVGGVAADAGYYNLHGNSSVYAGGGTTFTFTATGVTSSFVGVTASILSSTNAVSVTKVIPGSNSITVNFSADPGANTVVAYSAYSA